MEDLGYNTEGISSTVDEKGFRHYTKTIYDYDKIESANKIDKVSKILLGLTILVNVIDVCKEGVTNPDNAEDAMFKRSVRNATTLAVSYIAAGFGQKTGQWLGEMIGSKIGGYIGGAAGTAVAPGPGTVLGTGGGAALGGAIGSSVFGSLGSIGASYLGVKFCDYIFEDVLGGW